MSTTHQRNRNVADSVSDGTLAKLSLLTGNLDCESLRGRVFHMWTGGGLLRITFPEHAGEEPIVEELDIVNCPVLRKSSPK